MRRYLGLVLLAALGCTEHPDEGTVVSAGKGIPGVPGGSKGIAAERATPVHGGTLAITAENVAVVADPDRDSVFVADLNGATARTITLPAFAEPGRVISGPAGMAFVALRRSGQVLTVDTATATAIESRGVCPAPRGMAFDSARGELHVACATGELVTLPVAGPALRSVVLGGDLRDVLVDGARLLVTRFKSAELLVLDEAGALERTKRPHAAATKGAASVGVAWRTVALPSGGVVMLHQQATVEGVRTDSGGYGGDAFSQCDPAIVGEGVSRVDPDEDDESSPLVGATILPHFAGATDIALAPDGHRLSVVNVANAWGSGQTPTLYSLPIASVGNQPCGAEQPEPGVPGEPVALAYAPSGELWVQSREPAVLHQVGGARTIVLSTHSRADTGFALFHMNSGRGIACGSCHADGSEDGRVWDFAEIGPRRTQAVGGGVLGRAPFHWDGDIADFDSLVHEVFVSRMGAQRPNQPQRTHFARYVDALPAPVGPAVDPVRAARGEKLFETAECASCHSGHLYSNKARYDVGTGGTFKVPSLVGVGARAPFMHDGCAPTLRDRFGSCGGSRHGDLTGLGPEDITDLVAYLETL
jgi:hypothetical protein